MTRMRGEHVQFADLLFHDLPLPRRTALAAGLGHVLSRLRGLVEPVDVS